ncbi:hypothetical protein DPX16_20559 [Anabarilius grahami]|uniref:Alkylated DNA repair protein AlkB homologue 8 N-terminal domain-containing protein n=1 Tax=Anabarilius grahami TaxID=495550 RepID=A0A3N0YL53_ANAGA|nr:hypothetical protein DPX16_20559 [Anabarilius grahami]
MKEKLKAFQQGDWNTVNIRNRQIENDIRAKLRYKDKIEQEFSSILTGQASSTGHYATSDPATFADSLNSFYTRFDRHDHSALCEELLSALPPVVPSEPPFTVEDVRQQLSRCKVGKAPDIYKRSQQRLHILRKLHALSVTPHLLLLLYISIIQPILLYCSPCYFNMLSITNRNKLIKVTRTASKMISLPTTDLSLLNSKAVTRMARTVSRDSDHPLHIYFSLLPSGRRYRTLRWRRARFS